MLLDDDPARVVAAAEALAALGLPLALEHARTLRELEARLERAPLPWLISLDYDLGTPHVVREGVVDDPGTGLGAARVLAARGHRGQVLVHSSAPSAAEGMRELLADAGVSVARAPLGAADASAWAEAVLARWQARRHDLGSRPGGRTL
ncbi:MAG: cyclic-phosphate processing receiver domain-containing protein [Planctomycetota bacterium]